MGSQTAELAALALTPSSTTSFAMMSVNDSSIALMVP